MLLSGRSRDELLLNHLALSVQSGGFFPHPGTHFLRPRLQDPKLLGYTGTPIVLPQSINRRTTLAIAPRIRSGNIRQQQVKRRGSDFLCRSQRRMTKDQPPFGATRKKRGKAVLYQPKTSKKLRARRISLKELVNRQQNLRKSGRIDHDRSTDCLLYTSPSPRDKRQSRMPPSA